jgi:hypothetical protein
MPFPSKRAQFFKLDFKTEQARDLFDWMYEHSLDYDTVQGQLAWGQAMCIADDHPDWTFWQVLEELRRLSTQ